MTSLKNARYEAYARARVRGLDPKRAYYAAGYSGEGRNYGRVEQTPKVIARIEELRGENLWSECEDLGPLIDELGRLVKAAGRLDSAASLVAARGLIAEAARLKILQADRALAQIPAIETLRPEMSREEWMATYGEED